MVDTESPHNGPSTRLYVDACTDLAELRRSFINVEMDIGAELAQGKSERQAAEAGPAGSIRQRQCTMREETMTDTIATLSLDILEETLIVVRSTEEDELV